MNSPADRAIEQIPAAIAYIADKWVYFLETLPLKDNVPLKEKIQLFFMPAEAALKAKFSIFDTAAGNGLVLLIVCKAVEASGTHPAYEIEQAMSLTLPQL